MKISHLALAAASLGLLASAAAAPPPAGKTAAAKTAPAGKLPAADKAATAGPALDLARLIVSKDNYGTIMTMIGQQTMAQAEAAAQQSGQQLPADVEGKLKKALAEALPYDDVVKMSATAYGSQFSSDELGKLVEFYKTAVGQKLAKQQPEIGAKVMMQIMDTLQERMPAAAKKAGLGPGPGGDDPAPKKKPKGKPRM